MFAAVAGLSFFRERRAARRAFAERVGLDLAAMVALLPEELRSRPFTHFVVAPGMPAERIAVGLVYATDQPFRGTPPNVGLIFDRRTGHLADVKREGIGLGVK